MITVSFFSFKGGVGRTQALLNTAYLLAEKKYFVVMLDMDIHAPGESPVTIALSGESPVTIALGSRLDDFCLLGRTMGAGVAQGEEEYRTRINDF